MRTQRNYTVEYYKADGTTGIIKYKSCGKIGSAENRINACATLAILKCDNEDYSTAQVDMRTARLEK